MDKISFRDKITKGTEHIINLKTNNGKTGYRIKQLTVLPSDVEAGANEACVKIYKKSQDSKDAIINFNDGELLAAAMFLRDQATVATTSDVVIFDNEITNQNIFVTYADGQGSATEINYYIELERIALKDLQATQLTLKSLRTIASRHV